MKNVRTSRGYTQVLIVVVAAIVIVVGAFILFSHHRNTGNTGGRTGDLSSYCVGQTFNLGSSGRCVSDIQTLVNYMEHSGLTECQFAGGATLTVDGVYDGTTATQVRAVQGWANCYAKQEGFTSNVQLTSNVDKATWGELCTYGYTNPSRNGAKNASSAISAGKDAGCAQLQS
jgi:hypothetical protein